MVVFLHEIEMQGLIVEPVQVLAVCGVSVILNAVSECDLLMVLGASSEAVQDLRWQQVSMVCFVKQFL